MVSKLRNILCVSKINKMKKLIDIPENILQELKILAVKSNMPLKNYIEVQLVKIVEATRSGYNGG